MIVGMILAGAGTALVQDDDKPTMRQLINNLGSKDKAEATVEAVVKRGQR